MTHRTTDGAAAWCTGALVEAPRLVQQATQSGAEVVQALAAASETDGGGQPWAITP